MTHDEAMDAFYKARKEYARIIGKYNRREITEQERDVMRGILNATMRHFRQKAKKAEKAQKEKILCNY
jgi:hypothetical protein